MKIEELIQVRRTFHEFTGKSVDKGLVEKALRLALFAPNHKNTFPWAFYILGEGKKTSLIDLAVELKRKKSIDGLSDALESNLRKRLGSCSYMVVIGLKKSDSKFQEREDYASVACGVQNISLYLHANGLGSKWSTGGFTSAPQTYEILSINKSDIEIVGVLLVGDVEGLKVRTPPKPNPVHHIFEIN